MDPGQWGSQASVCTPQTTGPNGPDRITRNSYNAASQLLSVTEAYGTSVARAERTLTYASNGLIQTVRDAKNNLTTYEYDGFDRLSKTRYPVTTSGANSSSTLDYEQLGYDPAGRVISQRRRDGQMIYYGYDRLGRQTSKNRPNAAWWETDISYGYDLLGRMTSASDSNGHIYSFGYDALGRRLTEASNWYGTMTSAYDLAGRRTALTYPDGFYVNYDVLVTGEVSRVRENGATSGVGVLAAYDYDNLGRRVSMARGNGTATSLAFDPVSRLSGLTQDLAGSAQDVNTTFTYNPASQITGTTRSNGSYAFTQNVNVNRGYAVNGLNQYNSAGTVSLSYDGRGNLTNSGGNAYGYTVDNQLATSPGSNYAYDPLGRLFHESAANSAMLYDGSNMVLERDASSGAIRRRYVFGSGTDDPIVWYEGTGVSDRRWLHADERGSIVAITNGSGAVIAINSYDEYGIPASTNQGRFQYTGQMWLPDLGMYSYKARIYSPTLGRFLQTDPIGYADGVNWYNYVSSDPLNRSDPQGTYDTFKFSINHVENGIDKILEEGADKDEVQAEIVVNGKRLEQPIGAISMSVSASSAFTNFALGKGVAAVPQNEKKKLPKCAQDFLRGRIASNPADITLHRGSPFELTGNSVTFANDVYLAGNSFGRSDRSATIHKFHEIQHTSQYARGYSALNQAFAYAAFGGHDASPFEQAADKFAQNTYDAYKAAGLDKTCPF
jgi:RHS repeat-associated protein